MHTTVHSTPYIVGDPMQMGKMAQRVKSLCPTLSAEPVFLINDPVKKRRTEGRYPVGHGVKRSSHDYPGPRTA